MRAESPTRSAGIPMRCNERKTDSALRRALFVLSATRAAPPLVGATATNSNVALGRRSRARDTALYSAWS